MDGRLAVELPEAFAGGAQWATYAGSFADVSPPEIARFMVSWRRVTPSSGPGSQKRRQVRRPRVPATS